MEKYIKSTIDHQGNEFLSDRDMCVTWGMGLATYNKRMELGWTTRDALTVKLSENYIIDPLGNEFENEEEMVSFWGNTDYTTYLARCDVGFDMLEALAFVEENCYRAPSIKTMGENNRFFED